MNEPVDWIIQVKLGALSHADVGRPGRVLVHRPGSGWVRVPSSPAVRRQGRRRRSGTGRRVGIAVLATAALLLLASWRDGRSIANEALPSRMFAGVWPASSDSQALAPPARPFDGGDPGAGVHHGERQARPDATAAVDAPRAATAARAAAAGQPFTLAATPALSPVNQVSSNVPTVQVPAVAPSSARASAPAEAGAVGSAFRGVASADRHPPAVHGSALEGSGLPALGDGRAGLPQEGGPGPSPAPPAGPSQALIGAPVYDLGADPPGAATALAAATRRSPSPPRQQGFERESRQAGGPSVTPRMAVPVVPGEGHDGSRGHEGQARKKPPIAARRLRPEEDRPSTAPALPAPGPHDGTEPEAHRDRLVAVPDSHTVVVPGPRGLPAAFRVGDRLPSGARLLAVDVLRGEAETDRGALRLE